MGEGCAHFREAISARADGEDPGVSQELLVAHLDRCADCRSFAATVESQRRRLRFRAAEPVPDLSERILATLPPTPARGRPRKRAALVAAVVAVLAGAGAGAWTLIGRSSPSGSRYPGAVVLPISVGKPTVTLTDTSGRPYNFAAETAGQATLLYFGYTHCHDVCPLNMALAAAAIRQLPSAEQSRVTTVFVTTDPARDTPPVLRSWLNSYSQRFVGLTGSTAQIHEAETQVGMPLSYVETDPSGPRTADYLVAHSGYTIVYPTSGSSSLQVDPSDTPAKLATTLRHLLSAP